MAPRANLGGFREDRNVTGSCAASSGKLLPAVRDNPSVKDQEWILDFEDGTDRFYPKRR